MTNSRYKKIIVPIDCSGWSERAIPHAINIARHNQSEIVLLHIFQPPAHEFADQIALAGQDDQIQQIREETKQKLMALRSQVRDQNVNVRVQFIEGTGVAHHICDYINSEDADLVIMTTHGRTGLARFLFGSVTHKVMQEVKVPVLLIRPDKEN